MQSGVTIYLLTCTSMDIYVDYQRAALQFNQLNTEVVLRIEFEILLIVGLLKPS